MISAERLRGAKHSPLGRGLRNPGGPGQIYERKVPFPNFITSKRHDRGWGGHILCRVSSADHFKRFISSFHCCLVMVHEAF